MKTTFSNRFPGNLCVHLTYPLILAGMLLAQPLFAMPRGPFPPYPESPPLYSQSFDQDYFAGQTNDELTVSGLGMLDQSWSGYALQRTSASVVPFVVPALAMDGQTNVACDVGGALRFWIVPSWTSGLSNAAPFTLLEMDAVSGTGSACAWSLQISPNGNTISLFSETDSGPQEVLQASIDWLAGTPHNIVLDYGPQSSSLYLDGALAAQGADVASVPLSLGQLVLGCDLSGANSAGADFDEFYSFDQWLSAADVASYYGVTSTEAAQGPMTWQEGGHGWEGGGGFQADTIHTAGDVYDPNNDTPCSPGGPVYITNIVATPQTNGTTTVSFDIQGGTNGVFYDIFATPDLNASLGDYQWPWIGQGLTCNHYTFTGQPAEAAFYMLELPAETMTIGFGDNGSGQCNVPANLTNAIAIAAGGYFSLALTNGHVIGWGDNTYGQTNIPAGLSNVTAIAAGMYHGVALLANGSVTNWGSYLENVSYISVANYSSNTPPPLSNVVAIAAGVDHDAALLSNGTVVTWGYTNSVGNYVPPGLTNVSAIGSGWSYNEVLLSNGIVKAWGTDLFGQTNVPAGLTNVAAIAAGPEHSLALLSNGIVVAWGYSPYGETNVPAGLSNIVAVSAGGIQSLALQADGTPVAWGNSSLTNIPAGMVGVKAISAGFEHNLVIESGLLDPVIFTEPTDQYAVAGGSATFSAAGQGVAGVEYQWQSNGVNIVGATNSTLTLTNAAASYDANYDVVVSGNGLSLTSSVATFTLIVPPGVQSVYPPTNGTTWINYSATYNVQVTNNAGTLSYGWQSNGVAIPVQTSSSANPAYYTSDFVWSVGITNAAGSTNVAWNLIAALPGMVETWGSDASGECNRPVTLTNTAGISAGEYQSVAVTDSGTVMQWGQYWNGGYYSVTNSSVATLPPNTSNLVAVSASIDHVLGLTTSNTVVSWGLTNSAANYVPTNLYLTNVSAIGCGWAFNVALRTNGTVAAWGDNLYGQTNVPEALTNGTSNVLAIAAGAEHSLALLANGQVVAWGYNGTGQTNVPAGLSNVVAVAAGDGHSMALKSDGTVVAWGGNGFGQTNVPAGLSNVMAIAAGGAHSVALKNDGTLVAWGANANGQTNIPSTLPTTVVTVSGDLSPMYTTNFYSPVVMKLIAAGGNHTMTAVSSSWVQYPIDVSKDLLLIYNTNSADSSNVCQYYLANRPMVSNANVLPIGCQTNEQVANSEYTGVIAPQIQTWLTNNPTKRPSYVVLFEDIPSRPDASYAAPSTQVQINSSCATNWHPFVTSINMNGAGGTNDCVAYITKLVHMASNSAPGKVFIGATGGGYANTNWYFDDSVLGVTNSGPLVGGLGWLAEQGVLAANSSASVFYAYNAIITNESNVAGYYSRGVHNQYFTASYPTNGQITFSGASDWYLIETDESYNGLRDSSQGNFLAWYSTNAFGGTTYSCTPVGAVSHVEEPGTAENNPYIYFGLWAQGKSFSACAWNSFYGYGSPYLQVVGDPFVTK